jgi:hypothetical protein
VFFMYGLSFAVYLRSFITVGSNIPSGIETKATIILICAIVVTPYVLIPCLIDRFPRWVVQTHHPDALKYMTRWFFGLTD